MSQRENFVNIFNMPPNQSRTNSNDWSQSRSQDTELAFRRYSQCVEEIRKGFMEETRQQQVYEAFKQDVADCILIDSIEDDPFGGRQLSMSDFVARPNNATPAPPPFPDDQHILDSQIARSTTLDSSDIYLAYEEALVTPSAPTNSSWYKNLRCCCGRDCRQPQTFSTCPLSPPHEVDDTIFWHSPTDEEVEQARLRKDVLATGLLSPTNAISVKLPLPDRDDPDDSSGNLEKFVASQFDPECSSIRNIGFVNSTVILQDDRSTRANAQSQFGEISNMPTLDLMRANENDDVDNVKLEKSENDTFDRAFNFCITANDDATSFDRDNAIVAESTLTAAWFRDDAQTVEEEEQNGGVYSAFALDDLRYSAFMPEDDSIIACESLFEIRSPQVMQYHPDSDKENMLACHYTNITHPAVHPGFDLPEPDIPNYWQRLVNQTMNDQAIHDLGEPRHLSQLALGQPKDSSIIKRRSKRKTSGRIRPCQQFLPATTYGQAPRPDIASFFRANSRYQTTDFKRSQTPPIRISKKPTYGDTPRVKKRSARESFDLVDLCHENIKRAHREATKETLRGSFDLIELCHENLAREQSRKKPRLDVTPITPVSARLPRTPSSTASSRFHGSPMATALKGYPGQFSIHKPRKPSQPNFPTRHVFANHLHANGEIINLNFIPDTYAKKPDLSDLPDISTTIEHANLHHSFAEEILRSSEEEELRKEAYRECAAARLESVPVGFYRYFAGHMTVEEYNEAKMCVCWEGCWCNKMCTHFGDLACPCADNIVVGEEM